MNRLPETVSSKFTELFAVLKHATDDLKMAGAEANLIGDFSQVATLNDSCRKLQAFEAEIKSTVTNFASKSAARSMDKVDFRPKDHNRTRKVGGRLRVTIADKVIEEGTIADTFVKALRAFGLERVAKLNKVVSSIPLMARSSVSGYQAQRRCDGWFITTHVNKVTATNVLEEIGRALGVAVKVDFIER